MVASGISSMRVGQSGVAGRHRRGGLPMAVSVAAVLAVSAQTWLPGLTSPAFSALPQGAPTRKQNRANQHTRANLPDSLEVPLDDLVIEEEPVEPLPARRLPYTMNIVSHFPQHKHLHEESFARKAIEDKIVNSLENFEDIIRHLDVNLQMVENFHREKTSHHKPSEKGTVDSEEPILLDPLPDRESGHKVLAPYIFKVSVSLTNDLVVHLTNSEKHAQSSFTEALDHMVDVVRKSLREEKEKVLTSRKKEKRNMMPDTDEDGEDEEAIAARMMEDLDLEKDEATAKMYAKVEGSE